MFLPSGTQVADQSEPWCEVLGRWLLSSVAPAPFDMPMYSGRLIFSIVIKILCLYLLCKIATVPFLSLGEFDPCGGRRALTRFDQDILDDGHPDPGVIPS